MNRRPCWTRRTIFIASDKFEGSIAVTKITQIALTLVLVLLPGLALAQTSTPLLIPGKTSLYQRILTRPEAPLRATPGEGDIVESFAPFDIFYVYDRETDGDVEYLEVGRTLSDGPEGWMPADRTIQWRQTIVAGFSNPANRDRALVFNSREQLVDVLSGEDVQARLNSLREMAIDGSLPSDSPVVSIEPGEFVDISSEFYVLPILDSSQIRLPTNMTSTLLRIASLPLQGPQESPLPMSREEALANYKIGITFVIDTTRSMGPYIDETRRAVQNLNDQLLSGPEGDRFRFGLIGFRDSTDLVPELEYVTRTFLPLTEGSNADAFLSAIDEMEPADVNSNGFNEDSIGGVVEALNQTDWTPFGGRYIILITDAGPRQPGEDAAAGAYAMPQVVQEASAEGVAIFTMHLETDSGSFDHEYAAEKYRQLSRYEGYQLYYPVEGGDSAMLGAQVEALATQLTRQVNDALNTEVEEAMDDAPSAEDDDIARVGRAMQMAYLGRISGTQVPEIFEGWLTDRDPVDRRARPIQALLLMSKDELSTLHDVLQAAVNLGKSQNVSSDEFFTTLRETVAFMVRNPDSVQDAGTLGGLLGEYLEDLPYNSDILNITPERWVSMSPIQERQLVDAMESKVIALERLHNDADRWVALTPNAQDGERVTAVPLSLMP